MIWPRKGRPPGTDPALEHGTLIEFGAVRVRLRVNPRARRISLRLDRPRGEIIAVSPSTRRLGDAVAFARSRQLWMEEVLQSGPPALLLRPGLVLPLEGKPCRLERAAMRVSPVLHPARGEEPMRLVASGEDAAFGRAVVRKLKALALERARARTFHYTARLGVCDPPEVAVADARMRWGSCRGAGGGRAASIRYSWRLILAPPEVFDYVAAHEVAHLLQSNHSKAFWDIVQDLYGDLEAPRGWLRDHGRDLHALAP